ncbi:MAG: histidine kinase [Microthrixaceae bacterium]
MDALATQRELAHTGLDGKPAETTRTVTRRAELMVGIGVVAFLASAVLLALLGPPLANAQTVANGAFVVSGTLIVLRRPGNRLGPVLFVTGLGFEALAGVDALAWSLAADGHIRTASWIAWSVTWILAPVTLANVAVFLIFPTGNTETPWRRRLLAVPVAITPLLIVGYLFAEPVIIPQRIQDPLPHPFIGGDLPSTLTPFVYVVGFIPGLIATLAATVIAIVELRRLDGIRRRQNQWFVLALAVYWPIAFINVAFDPLADLEGGGLLLDAIGFVLLPIAVLIAVLRYRLYEIDRIVTKSVVYLGLAASATIVYAAIVVVPLLVFGNSEGDGPGLVLPIIATGVVAVLFEPLRRRLVTGANRLVYGERSSPHEVLSALTVRLADADTTGSLDDLAALLGAGTGATQATIWSGVAPAHHVVGRWSRTADGDDKPGANLSESRGPSESSGPPESSETSESIRTQPGDDTVASDTVTSDTVASAPVTHGGEVLGEVVIAKPPDDPVSPLDVELLHDVAGGAGMIIRNVGLNAELEQRTVEVRESRRRLIAAQDTERHRLERDLHDGAQQEIVALKVKLGLAQTIATREGADDIATKIEDLAGSTQDAVDAMRAVAHGIYPPLLEAEGLGPALVSLRRSAPLALTVDVALEDRLPRSAEQTVYFCVVETLQRLHDVGATTATARLAVNDDELCLTLDHDGPVVEVVAVTDRVDAAEGSVEVDPDGRISCRVPLGRPIEVTS